MFTVELYSYHYNGEWRLEFASLNEKMARRIAQEEADSIYQGKARLTEWENGTRKTEEIIYGLDN